MVIRRFYSNIARVFNKCFPVKSNIFIIFIISFISVLSSCTKEGLSETEIESYLGGTWLATYWQNLSEGEIPCAECWNIDSIENGKMK